MKLLETVPEFRRARAEVVGSLGLVPTMGYLHEGHLALVRRARAENDLVAVSIFVNPSQFGPAEDYQTYPRDLQRDLALLEREGVDLVFAPSVEELYPPGFDTWVEMEGLAGRLEGESRPGHFRGVVTVVAKLFNIVRPHRAYFGQKDAQQLWLIGKMVADLNMDLELVAVPTVRETDGLALSSRNAYLSPQERRVAPILWKALTAARELWEGGEQDAEAIRKAMTALIEEESLARVDYVSVADSDTLEELDAIDRPALVSLAVWIGETRLIDNITLE
ncbi:MAG: pantoate--beta-alanine ligase [Dehalococcoidia bacterium]